MKTLIDLNDTIFSFKEVIHDLPITLSWNKKGELVRTVDFGTVLIGHELITSPEMLLELEDAAVGDGPLFSAPDEWSWGHIAKAMGIFPSTSQARKNGWDGLIEPGFHFRPARINKVRGEFLLVKVADNSPWVVEG